jgi:hypothetical protein
LTGSLTKPKFLATSFIWREGNDDVAGLTKPSSPVARTGPGRDGIYKNRGAGKPELSFIFLSFPFSPSLSACEKRRKEDKQSKARRDQARYESTPPPPPPPPISISILLLI